MTTLMNPRQDTIGRPTRAPERIAYECCPLCDGTEIEHVITADCSRHPLYQPTLHPHMTWLRCVSCTHVFTSGYFTKEALEIIFGRTHANQQAGFEIENQRRISARMVEKILPYARDGHWLDVGFGNGSLLFAAEEYGFTPVGLDLRAENVRILQTMEFEAHCLEIERLDQPGRFRVISMADVLEHIPHPIGALKAVHELLDDRGVLFVSMPNIDCMLWKVLSQKGINPYWGEIEHYHNFGRKRLYALLEDQGFEPVSYGISERYRACMEVVAKKRGA